MDRTMRHRGGSDLVQWGNLGNRVDVSSYLWMEVCLYGVETSTFVRCFVELGWVEGFDEWFEIRG